MDGADLYIGRGTMRLAGSEWASPFTVKRAGSREDAIEAFRSHLRSSGLQARLGALAGSRLRCHCHEGQACHGDVIIQEFDKVEVFTVTKEMDILLSSFVKKSHA